MSVAFSLNTGLSPRSLFIGSVVARYGMGDEGRELEIGGLPQLIQGYLELHKTLVSKKQRKEKLNHRGLGLSLDFGFV